MSIPPSAAGLVATLPPAETVVLHTRIMKCALEVEDSRAYWARVSARGSAAVKPEQAFEQYWFGARSLPRIGVLLTNMRARFDAYPSALSVLRRWQDMPPETRRLVCHWHLQLSDPLYRRFTSVYLVGLRERERPEVTRDMATAWMADNGEPRWTLASRVQFASKLLSAAYSAGLVATNRDPRPLTYPRPSDEALTYLLYLLRELRYAGTLIDNPYLRSVGLSGAELDARLRSLPAIGFQRQGELVDVEWVYPNLQTWADARWGHEAEPARAQGGTP